MPAYVLLQLDASIQELIHRGLDVVDRDAF
jgi:hypothetical protein